MKSQSTKYIILHYFTPSGASYTVTQTILYIMLEGLFILNKITAELRQPEGPPSKPLGPLLGVCNSHNKSMQRHIYRPVYFRYFLGEIGQFQST